MSDQNGGKKPFNRAQHIDKLRKQASRKMLGEATRAQQLAEIRAKFAKEKEERRKKLEDEEALIRKQKEEEKLRLEEETLEQEVQSRTREYFYLNFLHQQKQVKGEPTYLGDIHDVHGAWRPSGEGEFRIEDEVVYKGKFDNQGMLHGNGYYEFFRDGQRWTRWEGHFEKGRIHGVGKLVAEDGRNVKDAIARDNVIVCFKDDLIDGRQVEFHNLRIAVGLDDERPRATILRHVKGWRYRIRFHDEMVPREKEIDFTTIGPFKILDTLPLIYPLSHFNIPVDQPRTYNYYEDVYGAAAGKPKLGVAGGRRLPNMQYINTQPLLPEARGSSDYKESYFEAVAAGLGAAAVAEEADAAEARRKKQWDLMTANRLKEMEGQRQKAIEVEQRAYIEDALSQARRRRKSSIDAAMVEMSSRAASRAVTPATAAAAAPRQHL